MGGVLWFCVILSGAAALALEMLWMRSAGLVLGQTAETTATVLACFFAGLALGTAAARRVLRAPVWWYGRLELGASAGALWSVLVFRLLGSDGGQRWLMASGPIGRAAGVAIAIVPAAACLGATLPAIGQGLVRIDQLRRRGGVLYAANTFGGAIGTAAMGFVLPGLIGVTASYGAAAMASAVAGTIALAVNRRQPRSSAPPESQTRPTRRGRLRAVAAGAGALGLALEVLWTRLFAQVLHNSIYSFTAIALVFLLALAAGSALASLMLRRARPASVAAIALLAAAAATAAGVWIFVRWTDGLAYVGMRVGLGEYLLRVVALAAGSVGPAALASGFVLPALWAMWAHPDSTARPLGDLATANTVGAIAGAVAAAFIALPLIGVRGTLLMVAMAYVALADLIAAPHRLHVLAYAAMLGIFIIDPIRIPLAHLDPRIETLKAAAEGPSGIVTLVDDRGDLQLRLDNYYVLGGTAAETNERRLGLVPLLLHPHPRQVAFVGLATGITASAAPAVGVDETTVVELIPEVAAAAGAHFGRWNANLLQRSDVHLVIDDGRHYLTETRRRFDVIVSDLFIPWHAGAGSLYTREMYATVARRLAPGGLFCQWLPLYQLTREEFDIITRTFLSVFPQASLWRADFYPDRPVVGLLAQLGAPADLDRIRQRTGELPEWSRDPLLASARGLMMLNAGNLAPAADLFRDAPINTDDRPLIEFTAPTLTRINAAGDKDWFTGEALGAFYDRLGERGWRAPDPLLPASDDVLDARTAGRAMYHYALAATRHDDTAAAELEATVRALVPDVIQMAESSESLDLREARRQQANLRAEQTLVRRQMEAMERRLAEITQPRKDTP